MKPDHIVRIWGKTEGDDAMAGVAMGFGGQGTSPITQPYNEFPSRYGTT